jgi:hypothetical protein
MGLSEAFVEITELAKKLEKKGLQKYPGLWEYIIDENWKIKLNKHDEMIGAVPGHHCQILYRGWPKGMIARWGGWMSWGPIANENTFIEAVQRKNNQMRKQNGKYNGYLTSKQTKTGIFSQPVYWMRLDD